MEWLVGLVAVALAYAAGSVPVAYLVSRAMRGVDIRALGSGNVGATNALLHVGLAPGLVVLAVDVGKGTLAMLLPGWLGAPMPVTFAVVTAVVVGHNWPVFMRFQGGRGVAPVLGASLAVLPLLTLAAVVPVVLTVWRTRNIVPGSVVGFLTLNSLTVATGQPADVVALCALLTLVPLAAHVERSGPKLRAALRQRRWPAVLSVE